MELRVQLAEAKGMIKGLEQGRRQEHESCRLAMEAVRGSQQEAQLSATLASVLDKVGIARTACGVASWAPLGCRGASLLLRLQAMALHLLKSWAAPGCLLSCYRRPQPACSTLPMHGWCQATPRAARHATDARFPSGRSRLQRRRLWQPGWQLRTPRPR